MPENFSIGCLSFILLSGHSVIPTLFVIPASAGMTEWKKNRLGHGHQPVSLGLLLLTTANATYF
jgi:hypothetical protein